MDFPFGDYGIRAEECAKAVNRVLRELVLACTDGEEIKNSCDISVLGYGQADRTVNAFSGDLANTSVVTIQDLTDHCLLEIGTKADFMALDGFDDEETGDVAKEQPEAEAFEVAASQDSES